MSECQATRYVDKPCSETPPKFQVTYRAGKDNKVMDRYPACFGHGLAEVDRHAASGGMARCDLEPIGTGLTSPDRFRRSEG